MGRPFWFAWFIVLIMHFWPSAAYGEGELLCSDSSVLQGSLATEADLSRPANALTQRRRVTATTVESWLAKAARASSGPVSLENISVRGALVVNDLKFVGDLRFANVVFEDDVTLSEVDARSFALDGTVLRRGLHIDGLRTARSQVLKGGVYCRGIRATRIESGGDLRIAETRACDLCPLQTDNAPSDEDRPVLGLTLAPSKIAGDLELIQVVVKAGATIRAVQVGRGSASRVAPLRAMI